MVVDALQDKGIRHARLSWLVAPVYAF